MRPVKSSSTPVAWRLPESSKRVAEVSGSVLRSLFLMEWNSANRVDKSLSALSSLAPISKFWLLSGGVLAARAIWAKAVV